MHRLASRAVFFTALFMWVAEVTWASDIACDRTYRSQCEASALAGHACREAVQLQPRGRQLICEYAMLNEAHERIFAEQQRGKSAGTVRAGDLDAWRKKRDACTTVQCLDQLFATSRTAPPAPASLEVAPSLPRLQRSPRQPLAAKISPEPKRTTPAVVSHRSERIRNVTKPDSESLTTHKAEEPEPPVPRFESVPPVPLSLRDSLPPLPPLKGPTVGAPNTASTRSLAWVLWLVGLLAFSGAFYWLAIRKQATHYLDVAFISISQGVTWLRTLPRLTFVLAGLTLMSGLLLIVLLAGSFMYLPGF